MAPAISAQCCRSFIATHIQPVTCFIPKAFTTSCTEHIPPGLNVAPAFRFSLSTLKKVGYSTTRANCQASTS